MGKSNKYILVVGGPTAVGKTQTSIAIAKDYQCPIISADSRQFYREMTIGTAVPTAAELAEVPHHMVGHLSIHDDYTVGAYERDALELIGMLMKQHQVVVLTGGTGLYISAVCEGLHDFPQVPQEIRNALQAELAAGSITALQEELLHTDPKYYNMVDIHNPQRLIRALGIIRSTGLPFSTFWQQPKVTREFIPLYLSLQVPRTHLYNKINLRVDQMIQDGLVEEARDLYPYRALNSLQTVGYKELFQHFDGEITLDQAIDKIKQHTRNYAKRQMTWFRNQGNWHHMHPEDIEGIKCWIKDQIN